MILRELELQNSRRKARLRSFRRSEKSPSFGEMSPEITETKKNFMSTNYKEKISYLYQSSNEKS